MDSQTKNVPIKRQQEIALIILKQQQKNSPVLLNKKEMDSKIDKIFLLVKEYGVSKAEIRTMMEEYILVAAKECFDKKAEVKMGFKK